MPTIAPTTGYGAFILNSTGRGLSGAGALVSILIADGRLVLAGESWGRTVFAEGMAGGASAAAFFSEIEEGSLVAALGRDCRPASGLMLIVIGGGASSVASVNCNEVGRMIWTGSALLPAQEERKRPAKQKSRQQRKRFRWSAAAKFFISDCPRGKCGVNHAAVPPGETNRHPQGPGVVGNRGPSCASHFGFIGCTTHVAENRMGNPQSPSIIIRDYLVNSATARPSPLPDDGRKKVFHSA